MATTLQRSSSAALFDKAQSLFPGGVNSPVRAFKSVGGTPLFVDRGAGAHIWDADGNEFIDFCCSWGPLILGHAHPSVVDRVTATLANGTSFGTPTRLENQLGELILSNHRYADPHSVRVVGHRGCDVRHSPCPWGDGSRQNHQV